MCLKRFRQYGRGWLVEFGSPLKSYTLETVADEVTNSKKKLVLQIKIIENVKRLGGVRPP